MTISIPQLVFDVYNQYVDYMLGNDNFSRLCTLFYPPRKEPCEFCTPLGGTNINTFQSGGPAPFNFNSCQYCGGKGFREQEITGTIRLRIFWRKRDWIKTGNINFPDAECQIFGFKSDLPHLLSAEFISLISEEKIINKNYILSGKPFIHGFGKTRYFIGYLEEASS